MTYHQKLIRQELARAEKMCNHYFSMASDRTTHSQYYNDKLWEIFHHMMGRRRFYIQELVKFQIREFNRG